VRVVGRVKRSKNTVEGGECYSDGVSPGSTAALDGQNKIVNVDIGAAEWTAQAGTMSRGDGTR